MPRPLEQFELTGLGTDLPDYSYPPDIWTNARNIEFNNGFAQLARGYGRVFGDALWEPRWLVNSTPPGLSHWVYGTDVNIGMADGTAQFDITPAVVDWNGAGRPQPFSGGIIQGQVVINPEGGTPLWWNNAPGDICEQLPDWPVNQSCKTMRPFREFLIAMDITESGGRQVPELILWSDAAAPGTVPQSWTAGVQSLAGSATASYNPGGVVDGQTLRDQFYVYKTHTVFVLQLVGGAFVFNTRPVFSTIGALSKNCVVEYRGEHIVFGDGDVIRHDGVNAESIIDRVNRRRLFQAIDEENFQNCFATIDKTKKEIWFGIPQEGGPGFPTAAAVYSIADNRWGFRDLQPTGIHHMEAGQVSAELEQSTWAQKTTTWSTDASRWNDRGIQPIEDTLVMADARLLFQAVDDSGTYDGDDPQAIVSRTGLDMGAPQIFKYVKRVWPKIDGTTGMLMQVRAGGAKQAGGPITWDEWKDFRVLQDKYVGVDASGRYLGFEFRSQTGGRWSMPGFDVEMTPMGRWG